MGENGVLLPQYLMFCNPKFSPNKLKIAYICIKLIKIYIIILTHIPVFVILFCAFGEFKIIQSSSTRPTSSTELSINMHTIRNS